MDARISRVCGSQDVCVISECFPHEEVMARFDVIAHHGGAGTVATGNAPTLWITYFNV